MATITERPESRAATSGASPTVELIYNVYDEPDDVLAHAALEAHAPAAYRGLVRQNTKIDPSPDVPGLWTGTATYGPITPLEVGSVVTEFDTGGGSVKITQSLATIASYAPDAATAPDFGGAINVTKDGVEGVEIRSPAMRATIRVAIDPEDYDEAYVVALSLLAKKVNNAPFKGWAAGEVIFDGGIVTANRADKVEITLQFEISPNATGLTVGEITGISKDGWDYLWVLYEDTEDGAANRIVKRPIAVYVERVYERGDFSLLGV